MSNIMLITIGSTILRASLYNNTSVTALKDILNKSPLTVEMNDYGNMEKVGPIGTTIPRNDVQMNTEPGDVIVYLGTNIVIYYDRNSWSLTPIGKINGITQSELKQILGEGSVTVTFSLPESTIETESDHLIDNDPSSDVTSNDPISEGPLSSMSNTENTEKSDSSDQSESSLTFENPDQNIKEKNNKTAIIAGSVSAVAVVVIVVALTLTCYFKKYLCFGSKTGGSTSEVF